MSGANAPGLAFAGSLSGAFRDCGKFQGLHSVRRDVELVVMHGLMWNDCDCRESCLDILVN